MIIAGPEQGPGGRSGFPLSGEADVVLADGGTLHLRPIRPEDKPRLAAFHARLSPQTIYYRFFGAHQKLTPRELERTTTVDHDEREALIALLGEDMVGYGGYEQIPGSGEAEVAFVVEDAHQGRGIGSVLLEHLAALARQRGIRRFVAEVMPSNAKMVRVFHDIGWQTTSAYDDGAVRMSFPIEPTPESLAVMRQREHHAEARSIQRLLTPSSVAVIGASRDPAGIGHRVFVHLINSRFQGPVYPVNDAGGWVASVRAYPSVLDVPDAVDLAVITTPAQAVPDVVRQCARKRVRDLVIISSGFAEVGEAGRAAERRLVALARANGMRVVGPNCLGLINTSPAVSLNASLAPVVPARGHVGFFSQSGALGTAILERVAARGLGLSAFISAGNRADVSANDLLQYWQDDDATEVVLLYLQSFGNPRKFARLARRLGRRKPVVAVKSGRSLPGVPMAHAGVGVRLSDQAVDVLFEQAGVIRVDTLAQLLDVAQVLAYQPLPGGRRVAIVGNSTALGTLAADACLAANLTVAGGAPLDLGIGGGPAEFEEGLATVLADPDVDAVVTVFLPTMAVPTDEVGRVLAAVAARSAKPMVSTFLAVEGLPAPLRRDVAGAAVRGSIPSFGSPEAAVHALARAVAYAEWRSQPEGEVPTFPDLDCDGARAQVQDLLAAHPAGRWLDPAETQALFARYGIRVWPALPAATEVAAVAAAAQLGYPVALKATGPALRDRLEFGGVRLDLASEGELRATYQVLRSRLGDTAGLVVQAMAPSGVAVVVTVDEDPVLGALISFGLGGVATELLNDRAFRSTPLTDLDAAALIRAVRAAPLLFGYRGAEPVDTPAVENLLLRVGRLAEDLPELAHLALNPIVVATSGLSVLDATARITPPPARPDLGPRRLR